MSKDYDAIERAFKAWSSRKTVAEEPGKEWFTIRGFSARIGKSISQGDRIVKAMYDDGMLERRLFRVERNGVARAVPHYKNK